jgi:hypothetical protein
LEERGLDFPDQGLWGWWWLAFSFIAVLRVDGFEESLIEVNAHCGLDL